MNLHRTTHLILTALPRAIHRRGFGVQSPWAYELVRDVFFEPLPYYAYQEQGLRTPQQQQLFRIRNHFGAEAVTVIDETGSAAVNHYADAIRQATPHSILVIEHIADDNALLWAQAVHDPHTTVTFDLGRRGIVTFDPKRIKQNYLL